MKYIFITLFLVLNLFANSSFISIGQKNAKMPTPYLKGSLEYDDNKIRQIEMYQSMFSTFNVGVLLDVNDEGEVINQMGTFGFGDALISVTKGKISGSYKSYEFGEWSYYQPKTVLSDVNEGFEHDYSSVAIMFYNHREDVYMGVAHTEYHIPTVFEVDEANFSKDQLFYDMKTHVEFYSLFLEIDTIKSSLIKGMYKQNLNDWYFWARSHALAYGKITPSNKLYYVYNGRNEAMNINTMSIDTPNDKKYSGLFSAGEYELGYVRVQHFKNADIAFKIGYNVSIMHPLQSSEDDKPNVDYLSHGINFKLQMVF